MLISTLLNTIVHPNSTPNIQIIINNKNEFLNGVEKSPTKKLQPRIGWFKNVPDIMSAHLRFLHLRNIIVRLVFGRGNFNFIQNKTKQDQEDDD